MRPVARVCISSLLVLIAASLCASSVARAERRARRQDKERAPAATAAPAGTEVTLSAVIDLAVRQSPGLRRARLLRAAATEDATAAELEQEWVAASELGWRRLTQDPPNPEPVQLLEELSVDGQLSLAKRLPSGGALTVSAGLSRREQAFDVSQILPQGGQVDGGREVAENSAARAGLSLSQPLLRGLAAAGLETARKARAQSDSARFAAELSASDALRDIVIAYWELAFAARSLAVAEKSFGLGRKQLEQTAEGRRAGLVAPNAVKAVEYQLAVREEALLRARVELRSRSMELRRLIALEGDDTGELVLPTEAFRIDDRAFELETLLAKAVEQNPELSQLVADKKVAELDVESARDKRKPQLDLTVDAALIGNGETLGNALGEVGSGNAYEIGVRLNLQYELGAARSAAVRGAEKRRSAVVVGSAERAHRIRGEVVVAFDAVKAARQRVTLAEKAISLANETLDAEQANFQAGRSSTYSVLDRQAEVVDSERSLARAVADYHQTVARLDSLTGEILERHGVELVSSVK